MSYVSAKLFVLSKPKITIEKSQFSLCASRFSSRTQFRIDVVWCEWHPRPVFDIFRSPRHCYDEYTIKIRAALASVGFWPEMTLERDGDVTGASMTSANVNRSLARRGALFWRPYVVMRTSDTGRPIHNGSITKSVQSPTSSWRRVPAGSYLLKYAWGSSHCPLVHYGNDNTHSNIYCPPTTTPFQEPITSEFSSFIISSLATVLWADFMQI